MAKTSPGEFISQVKAETRKETMVTTIFVVIMTTVLGLFFLGVDAAFSQIVQFLISLV